MNNFQILLNIVLVVCYCICENVIDVDDFLSPEYMPTTLLMLENPVSNKTTKYPNSTSVIESEGSLDKAIVTMGFHRQMMNEYLCRNYIAEQIVQDMTISKIDRRMGVISHGPGMSTLQQAESKSIQNGLLEDEGSSNYKNWLAKSTTLEDIYKHYDMGKRSDVGKDGEEKEDEEYDEQVVGYGYTLPKPNQAPSKIGHSGEGIIVSGGGGYPHPSTSGSGHFGGSSIGGHFGGSSFGGHSGGGSFGGGHHPVIHEQVIHVPKHHHHVKYVDKKEGLAELFEIAMTALAFLSFGMFIVHVIMCISMTTNTTTTAMGMMMPTNTGNTETSTPGMDSIGGLDTPGGEGIGMTDTEGDTMGGGDMGGEDAGGGGDMAESGGDMGGEDTGGGGDIGESGGGMDVDEMEGDDTGADGMGGSGVEEGETGGGDDMEGEMGGEDTGGQDMGVDDTGGGDAGGDDTGGDDAGGNDIGGDGMDGEMENAGGEGDAGMSNPEESDPGGNNDMPGGVETEGSEDGNGEGMGGGDESENGEGEAEQGGGDDTEVIDNNSEIDSERIKDLFFLNGDFRSELLRKKILDRLRVFKPDGQSRSILVIDNALYNPKKGTGTGTATGGTSTGGTATGGTATGGTATGGTATGSRVQEDDGITVETEEAAEIPVGPAFDGMSGYSMEHRHRRGISSEKVFDPNNYALNELARRVLISIEAATLAETDNGVCLRKMLCENNRYSRQLTDTNKIWIPVWSLGMSWLTSRLGINAQASTSMLDSLKASILGLGKAKCEILYQNCDLKRRRKTKKLRRPKI